jgi:signal peptidase I
MILSSASKSGGFRELAKTVVVAVLIALSIRTFAYEPFNIPSGSMKPTLLVGDYLFVSKISYGYSRYSLPFSPPLIPGRVLYTEPERGDVIVFKKPTDTSTDFIKRLIGLPGDKIQVRRGILHINGVAVPRREVEDFKVFDSFGRERGIRQYAETLPNGVEHLILEARGDNGGADNTGVYQVPEGYYFMMGDNRDNSVDSRDPSVGMVPRQNLVGRAEILFWAWDGRWAAWEIWNWPRAIRFSRLLQFIR